jgi:acyl-CoA synthetase (AMP-forming)/AMP-acid ligase II
MLTPKFSSLAQALQYWADRQPYAALLLAPETQAQFSYGQLRDLTIALSRYFDALGVKPGAHVALYMPNGLGCLALFLATLCSGRVIAPLNLLAHRSQLEYVLGHCEADLVLTTLELAPRLREAGAKLARIPAIVELDADSCAGPWSKVDGSPEPILRSNSLIHPSSTAAVAPVTRLDDAALLMYTSGTTGQPKGAYLSQNNLLAAAQSVANWHSLTPKDRVQSALPIYHINGQVIATLTPFVSGGSIIVPRKFSTSSWWEIARRYQPTWLNMVPTIIAYLLNDVQENSGDPADVRGLAACPGLRFGRSASAPLPPEHHQAFEERFHIPLIEAMGMTETASVVFCNPMHGQRKIGSPGQVVGVEAKVVSPEGEPLGDGERGEIWLRGPNVMKGYFRAPEQTRESFSGEWMRTGDLGHRDSEGFYFITGRLKELIIKGGENIAPREIDEALLRHPAVLEAAAVGIPDANYGQEILAAIILKEAHSASAELEASLREFCLRELGKYKSPKVYKFVEELPKGPSGKVQRLKILASLA